MQTMKLSAIAHHLRVAADRYDADASIATDSREERIAQTFKDQAAECRKFAGALAEADEVRMMDEELSTHREFTYYVNKDERGEFNADVRNSSEETVWETEGEAITDGFMRHKRDMSGLRDYLHQLGIMEEGDELSEG